MKIALVPMSAKPYHAGHHYLVERAAKENDKVFVYVSTTDRFRTGEFPVKGSAMEQIWRNEIVYLLPENVEVVYGGSPVRNVYEAIQSACDDVDLTKVFTVYSDVVDTKKNYSMENRNKYMEPLYTAGMVRFAAEILPEAFIRGAGAPDISATEIRKTLASGDFVKFTSYMPAGINSYACWNYLRS